MPRREERMMIDRRQEILDDLRRLGERIVRDTLSRSDAIESASRAIQEFSDALKRIDTERDMK